MSICHKLSIKLDSVAFGSRLMYSRAGTRLRDVPWMSVYVRGLSANMEGAFLGMY